MSPSYKITLRISYTAWLLRHLEVQAHSRFHGLIEELNRAIATLRQNGGKFLLAYA